MTAVSPRSALHAVSIATALGLGPSALADSAGNRKLVAASMHDVFSERNVAAAIRILAPDCIQHNPNFAPGLAGFQRSSGSWLAKLPTDCKDEVLHIVADDDLVVVRTRVTLTERRTGKPLSAMGFDLFLVAGGRIVDHWDSGS